MELQLTYKPGTQRVPTINSLQGMLFTTNDPGGRGASPAPDGGFYEISPTERNIVLFEKDMIVISYSYTVSDSYIILWL